MTDKFVKKRRKLFVSIRLKVAFFILFLIALSAIFFFFILTGSINQYLQNRVLERAESLSRNIAVEVAPRLFLKDFADIDNVVSKTKDVHEDIEYVAIVDTDMKTIAHTDVKNKGVKLKLPERHLDKPIKDRIVVSEVGRTSGEFLEVSTPIVFKNQQLGAVYLGIDKRVLLDAENRARNRMLTGFTAPFFMGILGILMLSYFITRPLKELSSGVNELKEGKRRSLKVYSNDELGKLTENFNEMSALITEQQQRLTIYAHELEETYISSVRVLAAAIDARDPYTHGHSARVAKLSLKIGDAIGLAKNELRDLEIACLFHDVGKLKIPDFILNKPGKLDSTEYEEMMRHTEYGADILSKAPFLLKYIPSVRYHHEWHNGKGYPEGLCGEEIPLFATIISIADSFDAMTTTRPYKKARAEAEAIRELIDYSGKQFNPQLVGVFIQEMNEHKWPAMQLYETITPKETPQYVPISFW